MNKLVNQYNPDYVSPPGETLWDILKDRGMTQAELAQRTGRKTKTINQIIKGIAPLTPKTAIQLERVLGAPASFWNNREKKYQEFLARQEEQEELKKQIDSLNSTPVKYMIKHGWIQKFDNKVLQIQEVLNFYGIASPEQYKVVLSESYYHKSRVLKSDPHALLAWLRKGEIEAQKIQIEPYSLSNFNKNLKKIRSLTVKPTEIFLPQLIELCALSGVALVFIPELPRTRIFGAVRWLNPQKALIQLSLRYKTDDHFWFSFFHEAGHIILHGKKDVFLDEDLTEGDKEMEANRFAANSLIPYNELERFRRTNKRSIKDIEDFAEKLSISPGIVVGQLQYIGYLPMSHCNKLKRHIDWGQIPD